VVFRQTHGAKEKRSATEHGLSLRKKNMLWIHRTNRECRREEEPKLLKITGGRATYSDGALMISPAGRATLDV